MMNPLTPTQRQNLLRSFEVEMRKHAQPMLDFSVDPARNVRRTDPVTSRKAAFAHAETRPTIRQQALAAITATGLDGMTDAELAVAIGRQLNSANKRRGELRDQGLVVNSGRTRKTPAKADAIVWIAAEFCREVGHATAR